MTIEQSIPVIAQTKRCDRCEETKPLADFPLIKKSLGYRNQCKKCHNFLKAAYHKKWREKHPERHQIAAQLRLDKQKQWRKNNPELSRAKSRKSALAHWYGMTEGQYQQMFKEQHGLCAICQQPEVRMVNGKMRRLSIDHNHNTNKIRELLCSSCNIALGNFQDNILVIESALKYLKKHSGS